MRSKLLVGAVIAAFALGATIVSASARTHKQNRAVTAVTLDSAPTVNCGSGTVPILHTMNFPYGAGSQLPSFSLPGEPACT
jgi:hypothetical protein